MGKRSYEVSRTVDAPVETVWTLLSNADGYSEWNRAVLSITGPIEQGKQIALVSIANPKRTFKLTVEDMSAPRRMVWTDGMPLGLFTGRRTYTLDEEGDGRTGFAMREAFTGPLAGLITKAIPDLTESFETFADSLKSEAERLAAN